MFVSYGYIVSTLESLIADGDFLLAGGAEYAGFTGETGANFLGAAVTAGNTDYKTAGVQAVANVVFKLFCSGSYIDTDGNLRLSYTYLKGAGLALITNSNSLLTHKV